MKTYKYINEKARIYLKIFERMIALPSTFIPLLNSRDFLTMIMGGGLVALER